MAVNRTVLPRKGIIQPMHGDPYETDLDQNWLTIDTLLQDAADVQAAIAAAGTVQNLLADLSINGVASGFTLSTSVTLTPGLTAGVLYAQGKRYAPASAPNPGPAPPSATNYLFYNSTTGFYYQASSVEATAGDALIGKVTTSGAAVTAVVQATKIYGLVDVPATAAPGNITIQHYFGHAPKGAAIQMTAAGVIWFQSPTLWDAANLYLVASDAGLTGKVQVW